MKTTMKYKIRFTGRKVGAIGIVSSNVITIEAVSAYAARIRLYENYEHIRGISIEEVKLKPDPDDRDVPERTT